MGNIKPKRAKGPRYSALQVLCAVETKGAYAQIALDKRLQADGLERRERGLATELVYGTLRRQLTLDWILGRFVRRPLHKLPAAVRNNLRMALYQIVFLDRIPHAAACNEATELAKKVGHKGTASFVNGVLRAILRNPDKADFAKAASNMGTEKALSLLHSHPRWLVDIWSRELGIDETACLCEANNRTPATFFRTNTLKISQEELLYQLTKSGVEAEAGQYAPEAIKVQTASQVTQLDSYKRGHFTVQDEAAMLVTHALRPRRDEIVYDLCAGLGGKTLHAASLIENSGEVFAFDIHGGKLKALQKAALRLGVYNVHLVEGDAARLPPHFHGKANRVMLDAPCSGWGVLGRKPDIRWRAKEEHTQGLVQLQRQLLDSAYACLAPNGRLVYSTCTIHRRENQDNIAWVLEKYNDLILLDTRRQLPHPFKQLAAAAEPLQLLPHKHGTDGFFIAVLRKRAT